jgi:signal peptidase I
LRSRRIDPAFTRAETEEIALSARALADLAQAVLKKDRPFRFLARGFSMSPFIRDGDILTISPVPSNALTLGDVAAVIHPETRKLVIHRVTALSETSVVIQGDNSPSADKPIPRTDILGRVSRVERNGRSVSLGLGPERVVIARLARLRHRPWLRPLLKIARPIFKP